MDRKYQVFISSTFNDLKAERMEAILSILDSENIPVCMELFKSGNTSQWDTQIAITSWTRRGRQPRSRMEPQALSGSEGTAAVRLRIQRPRTIQTTPPGCGSRAFCGAVRSARQQRRGCPRR